MHRLFFGWKCRIKQKKKQWWGRWHVLMYHLHFLRSQQTTAMTTSTIKNFDRRSSFELNKFHKFLFDEMLRSRNELRNWYIVETSSRILLHSHGTGPTGTILSLLHSHIDILLQHTFELLQRIFHFNSRIFILCHKSRRLPAAPASAPRR